MPETIYKLQPHRTIYLRGFDRRGAAAALHSASDAGFTASGVWRDQADFAVVVLWDADDPFGHYTFRYLPDFDFSGITLEFDLALTNAQAIDSRKYAWIDWPFLDYVLEDGTAGQVDLRQHMTQTGAAAASATWTVAGSCEPWDRVTLWFENYAFDYVVPGKRLIVFTFWWNPQGTVLSITIGGRTYTYTVTAAGGESGAQCAAGLAAAAASDPDATCTAVSNTIEVTPKNDLDGTVSCSATGSGADALWRAANPTHVVAAALRAQINGVSWPAGAPVRIFASGSGADVAVSADAGADGNFAELYELHKTATMALSPAGAQKLSGGAAPSSYHVSLDFAALGLTAVRQMWMTFAPRLLDGVEYAGEEWSAVFSGWTVADTAGKRALKVAGPGSVRVPSRDSWTSYSGAGWAEEAGWFHHGFARRTAGVGDSVRVKYSCGQAHDLYIGTSLYGDRGRVAISLDGGEPTTLDCYLAAEPAVVTRRRVRTGVAAGVHEVVLTLEGRNPASSGDFFYFDYLEAAVPSDVQEVASTYADVSVATDYDTDATYKLPPARLLWAIEHTGFRGRLNHYLGVFWWNERVRTGGRFASKTVTFGGTWADGDSVFLEIGGTVLGKSVFPADTAETVARHFAAFVNATLIGAWAEASGAALAVHSRSPVWAFTSAVTVNSAAGTAVEAGSLQDGVEGAWTIDEAAAPAWNRAVRDWHADFFAGVQARGWSVVTSMSMELVEPPDDWAARFLDGEPVRTDTGFAALLSTHCAFSDDVAAFQRQAFLDAAALMSAAGLTPWLQFGEFCWWYFSNYDALERPDGGMAFYDAYTTAAAQAALGRPLYGFVAATDDPAVNGGADAEFLRARIKAHIDEIRSFVLASVAGARFELLWPYDVNYPTLTSSGRGGRLLRLVNLPAEYEAKAGSGLDALKMEALAFGSLERHLERAREAIRFPYTGGRAWPKADVAYLMPWFNGGCPWQMEFLLAARREKVATGFWAWDHLCLLSWPLALPEEVRASRWVG